MALPALYDSPTFTNYLLTVLGQVGAFLGWDAASPELEEVVNDTLLVYGADDLSACDNIPKLRTLGRWQAWKAAVDALPAYYTLTGEVGLLTRSQVYSQASKQLLAAEIEAGPYGSPYRGTTTSVTRADSCSTRPEL